MICMNKIKENFGIIPSCQSICNLMYVYTEYKCVLQQFKYIVDKRHWKGITGKWHFYKPHGPPSLREVDKPRLRTVKPIFQPLCFISYHLSFFHIYGKIYIPGFTIIPKAFCLSQLVLYTSKVGWPTPWYRIFEVTRIKDVPSRTSTNRVWNILIFMFIK